MEECEEKNQEIQSEAYEAVFHKWMKWNAHSNIASRARCYLFQFIYTMNSVWTRRILFILKREYEDLNIEVKFEASIDIVRGKSYFLIDTRSAELANEETST